MRYLVIIEEGANSFGAYVPDLPGCVAVAETKTAVVELIEEAIEFHLEGMKEDGVAIPQPHSSSQIVEVRI
ncbi:MAG: type II toxin-antitoxin system HicB family antitoxin [Candidatus Competibacter denitrificans]